MKFAIIETGGKQYRVEKGMKLLVEKLSGKEGEKVAFEKVLLRAAEDGKKVEIGTPYLQHAVEAKILRHMRGKKKIVFRYHPKTRLRKKKGHRQEHTEVEITAV